MMQWLLVHLSLLKNLCGRKLKQLQLSERYVSIACRMSNLLFLHNYRRRARLPVVDVPGYQLCYKSLPLPEIVALSCATGTRQSPKKHSAKDLSSVTLDKQHTTFTVPANGSLSSVFYRALGKDFAESWNRHSAKKSNVTEWKRSRRVCRVSNLRHSANLLYYNPRIPR